MEEETLAEETEEGVGEQVRRGALQGAAPGTGPAVLSGRKPQGSLTQAASCAGDGGWPSPRQV